MLVRMANPCYPSRDLSGCDLRCEILSRTITLAHVTLRLESVTHLSTHVSFTPRYDGIITLS